MLDHYRFGIEEEFFLASARTLKTPRQIPDGFRDSISRELSQIARPEMLQSQIEVATPPSTDMGKAREQLAGYRRTLAAIGDEHELLVLAAGTHPLARWDNQRANPKPRYHQLMRELQMLGARNIVCGMHVHVSVPDPSQRVNLMRRMIPWLPVFLALSTSSPFWQARRTGLMGYRLAAYDELPRTGIPEVFHSEVDYRSYVDTLVAARAIPDESYIWWAVRPSSRYPTLELRIADSCTHVDDTVAIAALYRCLVRRLTREPHLNADVGATARAITLENKWIAQRHGIHGAFIDHTRQAVRSLHEIVGDMIDMLEPDAVALGCLLELHRIRDILRRGTSADRQLAMDTEARGRGRTSEQALADVVGWIASATREPNALDTPTLH
jgi:glutamate---cysteine ligase / carboxylate-amine ligase